MNEVALSASVKAYLRRGGYSLKELADALGLNARVLSRKLHGKGNAYLTHQEIQRIISELARWRAITTKAEALHLLEIAQVEPAIFSSEEWETPPLSTLSAGHGGSFTSNDLHQADNFVPHNLPTPTTRIIGREWAVGRLRQLLERSDVRLVTLVGSGGSGKTRLALHAAYRLAEMFAQGVWFVALAGQRDPALVPISIMQALQIQSAPGSLPLQSLIDFLKKKQLLLVLDNFEQVEEAATEVNELLEAVPGLKVLVTSRKILHLSSEHKFSVPPLEIPDPNVLPAVKELSRFGAVKLFLERAQAVDPDFAMTAENAAAIALICAKVDGLPLALELAAARVKVLPPAVLLERLARASLPVLTGGARNLPDRQQTLQATFNWSYDLLSNDEQLWFRRLGIFSGSWSLEAAEAIIQTGAEDAKSAADSISELDMLEHLVDNSLLHRAPSEPGQARFTMLETLSEYAMKLLVEEGEYEQLRDWHACFYLGEAEASEGGLRGPRQLAWLARVGADRDNFRAALEWSLQRARAGKSINAFSISPSEPPEEHLAVAGDRIFCSQRTSNHPILAAELCLRLSSALRPYWEWQGYLAEGRYWLGVALEMQLEDGSGETALAARAKALSEASRLFCLQNDQVKAVELAEESIALWQQLDDPGGLATAFLHRGWAAHAQGEYETARRAYHEGLERLSSPEDTWLHAQLFFYLGAVAGFTYDFVQMHTLYTQSRQLFERLGDTSAVADVLKDQGGLSLLEGNYTEAITCLLKSLKLCYELGHKQYMTTGMSLLSLAFGMSQKPDPDTAGMHSAKLQGAADGLMDALGINPYTRENPFARMVRQHIRSELGEQRYVAAWTEGRNLTIEQAMDLANTVGEEVLYSNDA